MILQKQSNRTSGMTVPGGAEKTVETGGPARGSSTAARHSGRGRTSGSTVRGGRDRLASLVLHSLEGQRPCRLADLHACTQCHQPAQHSAAGARRGRPHARHTTGRAGGAASRLPDLPRAHICDRGGRCELEDCSGMHVRCKGWKDTARSVAAPGACWVAALVRTKDTRTSRKGHEYVTLEVACQRSPVRCTAYSTQWCITERRSATLRPGRRGCWNDHSTYPLVLTCTVSLNVSAGGGGRRWHVPLELHVQSMYRARSSA